MKPTSWTNPGNQPAVETNQVDQSTGTNQSDEPTTWTNQPDGPTNQAEKPTRRLRTVTVLLLTRTELVLRVITLRQKHNAVAGLRFATAGKLSTR